jgi:hypothetical protein
VDASVVLLARRHSARVVTSDPDDIRRIDSSWISSPAEASVSFLLLRLRRPDPELSRTER